MTCMAYYQPSCAELVFRRHTTGEDGQESDTDDESEETNHESEDPGIFEFRRHDVLLPFLGGRRLHMFLLMVSALRLRTPAK